MSGITLLMALWIIAIPFMAWMGLEYWGSGGGWLVFLAILMAFGINLRENKDDE